MNALGYYQELTGEDEQAPAPKMAKSQTIESIMNAKFPRVHNANLRKEARKEWAKQIRNLLKELRIVNVSVTTPSYSMASSVNIAVNYEKEWETAHEPVHKAGEAEERKSPIYRGSIHFCPYCKARKEVHDKLENVILAAFPDLNNRSDSQSDYFDYCLSINY